jgi:hypothetical protein
MRVGDFSVEVIGAGGGSAHELESGHVLARPGQVYVLRLRNHGPLRCVADVSVDGHPVTGGGLVINAWSTVDLERPIHASERGRFTVVAEGDERVFGPDGGRDNPDLGLIEARFRRELPSSARPDPFYDPRYTRSIVTLPLPSPRPASPEPGPTWPRRPFAPPEWTPPTIDARSAGADGSSGAPPGFEIESLMAPEIARPTAPSYPAESTDTSDAFERAAGTGLTGSSDQEFVPVNVGTLETEATVIRLRLVIGGTEAMAAPRPLPGSSAVPARPTPRP